MAARQFRNTGHIVRSEEHTSELQSLRHLVCRLLLEKKKKASLWQSDQIRRPSSCLRSRRGSPLCPRAPRASHVRVLLVFFRNLLFLFFFFLKNRAPPESSPFPPPTLLPS